jgi:hypothetical protein
LRIAGQFQRQVLLVSKVSPSAMSMARSRMCAVRGIPRIVICLQPRPHGAPAQPKYPNIYSAGVFPPVEQTPLATGTPKKPAT